MTPPGLPVVASSKPQRITGGPPRTSGEPKTPAFADADTSVMTFRNRRATITVPVSSCKLERTIEGASSLTVQIHDPTLSFLNSEAIKGPKHGQIESFVKLENQVFAIAGHHLLKGHIVEVILEDEAVWRLRQNRKPLTMGRGNVTRAEFIKHMFAESGVALISPELHNKQPIQSNAELENQKLKGKRRKPGFSAHAKLTVKQQPADSEQRHTLETALAVAASHSSKEKAAVALLISLIQENSAREPNPLQLEPFNASGDHVDPNDLAAVCALFLTKGFTGQGGAIALAKAHPSWTPGEIAIAVQGPKNKNPDVYQVWAAEAKQAISAFTGADPEALQEGQTFAKRYQFERRNGEDSWACAQRLAEEVGWYLFIVDGEGHFYSGEYLKRSKPPKNLLIAPGADGLLGNPTFGYWTTHKYDDTVTVECHASKWGAPPGTIAEMEGYGAVDGRWVVTAITRERMKSSVTTITLGRDRPAKKEPAHELGQRTPEETSALEGGRGTALGAYGAAEELSHYKLSYKLGGGHGAHDLNKVANGGIALDCSSAVCWVLFKCGMRESDTAETSGELAANWGEAGEGKYMTVWANGEHVFIEFKVPGKPHSRLDTVPGAGEEDGPRLRPFSPLPEGSTHSFTPRRWPGQ
jgi:hypothetical protein